MYFLFITRLNGEIKTFVIEDLSYDLALKYLHIHYLPDSYENFWIIACYKSNSEIKSIS